MKHLLSAVLALAGVGVAGTAGAHPFHGAVGDLAAGYVHAFSGLDHLLAMFAVGVWAMQADRGAIVRAPLVFCAAVGLGAVLALAGLTVPGIEPFVAASVLALGLLIATHRGGTPLYAIALIAVFGVLHGLTHAVEQAPAAAALAGLLLASVTLHAAGAAAAFLFDQRVRAWGLALMAAGAWLVAHA